MYTGFFGLGEEYLVNQDGYQSNNYCSEQVGEVDMHIHPLTSDLI